MDIEGKGSLRKKKEEEEEKKTKDLNKGNTYIVNSHEEHLLVTGRDISFHHIYIPVYSFTNCEGLIRKANALRFVGNGHS